MTFAQGGEQEELEAKREQLQKEIEQINHLLFAQKEKKGSVLDRMEALDQKMSNVAPGHGAYTYFILPLPLPE